MTAPGTWAPSAAAREREVFARLHERLPYLGYTYFGEEQVRRLEVTGGLHSISCTGAASPRILVPWLEEQGLEGYSLSAATFDHASAGQ